jgi:hypothetical protein
VTPAIGFLCGAIVVALIVCGVVLLMLTAGPDDQVPEERQ